MDEIFRGIRRKAGREQSTESFYKEFEFLDFFDVKISRKYLSTFLPNLGCSKVPNKQKQYTRNFLQPGHSERYMSHLFCSILLLLIDVLELLQFAVCIRPQRVKGKTLQRVQGKTLQKVDGQTLQRVEGQMLCIYNPPNQEISGSQDAVAADAFRLSSTRLPNVGLTSPLLSGVVNTTGANCENRTLWKDAASSGAAGNTRNTDGSLVSAELVAGASQD